MSNPNPFASYTAANVANDELRSNEARERNGSQEEQQNKIDELTNPFQVPFDANSRTPVQPSQQDYAHSPSLSFSPPSRKSYAPFGYKPGSGKLSGDGGSYLDGL